MAQAAYSENDVRAMTADFEKANPDIKVNLEFVPYEGLRDKTLLAQGSGGYDVVLFDVIWPAEFATNKVLVDVTDRITPDMNKGILPGAWTTVEYNGKRYGMPWILDTKYLFYNKDMLAKAGIARRPRPGTSSPQTPRSSRTRASSTRRSPGAGRRPRPRSATTPRWSMPMAASSSTTRQAGLPDRRRPEGAAVHGQTVKDGITNPNSKEFLEEDVRRVFQNGEAAFALNWTYMYNLANDPKESKVAGQVGVVPAPGVAGVSEASAVNGSMGLGITTTSKHPDEAWKYIVFMTSQPVQNAYAKLSLPIWASSYDDPAVTEGQEDLIAAAKVGLPLMFPRPTTPNYQELSNALQVGIQQALLGAQSPEDALKSAADNSGL